MGDSVTDMAQRALLTDTEKEILAGERDVKDNYRYSVESRVRKRIEEELAADLQILADHPELFEAAEEAFLSSANDEQPQHGDKTVEPHTHEQPAATDGERGAQEPEMKANVGPEVTEAVESVAASWEDSPERLETRKQAAAVVLQHAIDSGDAIGKSSEIAADVRRAFPVDGQKEETYWRKNLRPALKEFGEYNERKHGYVVEPGEEF